MNKKLFVFDMDGTLTNSKNKVLPETIAILKVLKQKGHIIAIATGRPLVFVENVKGSELFDYIICTNGAYYYDKKAHQTYFDKFVPADILEKMIVIGKAKNLALFVNGLGNTVCSIPKENKALVAFIHSLWGKIPIILFRDLFNHVDKKQITQSTLLGPPDKIEALKDDFMQYTNKVEIRVADHKYLDACPKGVSKFSAIQKIIKNLDILVDNVIAFGDSDNDIEMLQEVGLGIAMENSTENVKKIAKEIIGNNEVPSIANKIKELIGEN